MPDDLRDVLVCARADAPAIVEGTTFDHVCAGCGCALLTAPSSQRMLREHPGLETICSTCFMIKCGPGCIVRGAVSGRELSAEIATKKPNPLSRKD